MRTFVIGILLLTSLPFALGAKPGVGVDRVVVYKHQRRLVLLSHGKELGIIELPKVRTYSILETPTVISIKRFTSPIQVQKILRQRVD